METEKIREYKTFLYDAIATVHFIINMSDEEKQRIKRSDDSNKFISEVYGKFSLWELNNKWNAFFKELEKNIDDYTDERIYYYLATFFNSNDDGLLHATIIDKSSIIASGIEINFLLTLTEYIEYVINKIQQLLTKNNEYYPEIASYREHLRNPDKQNLIYAYSLNFEGTKYKAEQLSDIDTQLDFFINEKHRFIRETSPDNLESNTVILDPCYVEKCEKEIERIKELQNARPKKMNIPIDKLTWKQSEDVLIAIFKEIISKKYLSSSIVDIAAFLKYRFDCFENIEVASIQEKLRDNEPVYTGNTAETVKRTGSNIILKWVGQKNVLTHLFREMKNEQYLINSIPDIAKVLKSDFDCFKNTKESTIRGMLKNNSTDPNAIPKEEKQIRIAKKTNRS